jgi:hypothetical protein
VRTRRSSSPSRARARSCARRRRGDKFVALDLAVDKLAEQLRRAKDKRVDARNHPRGAKLDKGSGSLAGIDVQPASVDVLRAVATGGSRSSATRRGRLHAVVIRTKNFDAEWMTVEEAVDRMELVGHDFFLFIDARTDHPSVVYRRKGWDYGDLAHASAPPPRRNSPRRAARSREVSSTPHPF